MSSGNKDNVGSGPQVGEYCRFFVRRLYSVEPLFRDDADPNLGSRPHLHLPLHLPSPPNPPNPQLHQLRPNRPNRPRLLPTRSEPKLQTNVQLTPISRPRSH